MSIIRSERHEKYLVVANQVARDKNLSYKARGLLISILSRPDNWETNAYALANESPDGRDAVLSGLKELEEQGYLVRSRFQDDQGHWQTSSIVYDVPKLGKPKSEKPKSDYPKSEKPKSENPTSKEVPYKELPYKEIPIKNVPIESIELAKLLATLIEKNGSKVQGTIDAWAKTIDLMNRVDGRSWVEIRGAIEWCQNDEFWRSNVLSADKLRKQYDRMRLQAQRKKSKSGFEVLRDLANS